MLYTYIHKHPYDSLKVETVEWCSYNVELCAGHPSPPRSSRQASPMTCPLIEITQHLRISRVLLETVHINNEFLRTFLYVTYLPRISWSPKAKGLKGSGK